MLSRLEHYALIHPHIVDLAQHPRCAITNAPLPLHIGNFKGNLGHEEVWELIVPLFPQQNVFLKEDDWSVSVTGPAIKLIFYCWALNGETSGLLYEIISQARVAEIQKGGVFFIKASHKIN